MNGCNRTNTVNIGNNRQAAGTTGERSAHFANDPYEGAARINSPRMEEPDSTQDCQVRPPLRPCPSRNGCGCGGFPHERRNGYDSRQSRSRMDRSGRTECGCNNRSEDKSPMDELRAVEFALDEVVLYLDAYPCDQAALDLYHHLLERRCRLVEQYQSEIGPLTPLGNMSHTKWEWVNRPFPWDYDANV